MGIKDNKDKMRVELDWSFIEEMAQRMNINKDKYPRDNWKQSIDVVELEDALMRHWFDYKRGDDKENHLAAIALNAMMIWYQKNALLETPPKNKKPVEEISDELFKKWLETINKSSDIDNNKNPWTPSKFPWENVPYCEPKDNDWKDKYKGGFLYSNNSNEYIGAPGEDNNFVKSTPIAVLVDPPSGWKYGFPKKAPYPLPDNIIEWVVEHGYPRAEVEGFGTHFHISYSEVYE